MGSEKQASHRHLKECENSVSLVGLPRGKVRTLLDAIDLAGTAAPLQQRSVGAILAREVQAGISGTRIGAEKILCDVVGAVRVEVESSSCGGGGGGFEMLYLPQI